MFSLFLKFILLLLSLVPFAWLKLKGNIFTSFKLSFHLGSWSLGTQFIAGELFLIDSFFFLALFTVRSKPFVATTCRNPSRSLERYSSHFFFSWIVKRSLAPLFNGRKHFSDQTKISSPVLELTYSNVLLEFSVLNCVLLYKFSIKVYFTLLL